LIIHFLYEKEVGHGPSSQLGPCRATAHRAVKPCVAIVRIIKSSWCFYTYHNNSNCHYRKYNKKNSLTEEYSFEVLSNRLLKARFIPNNSAITNIEIFGNRLYFCYIIHIDDSFGRILG